MQTGTLTATLPALPSLVLSCDGIHMRADGAHVVAAAHAPLHGSPEQHCRKRGVGYSQHDSM